MASKTLQSTIEIAGVLSPSLQTAIKNAVGKLEEMSEETLASVGAAEKLSAEIGAQESVLKSLQKGYADYIVSGKESSSEAQTLADKIQALSGELDENRGTLQAAERAAKRLSDTQDDSADAHREAGDAAEKAGEQAEAASEGYTILKDVIADLASEAISKAIDAFKELATEGDTALAMLEAKTGATGKKMEGFEDVMYEVYNANYGDSLGSVQEALTTVISMTDDLDNASLSKVTKSAIALEDVFGFDVTESMRAVNSLMDQFGITSDQAFNLVVQGAQNGLDQNGDLLDTINEYSVQFKNAGYSADDMFNMLANGTESGTWSVDKLGDAVKEFNIRMSDGTANDYLEDLGVDVDKVMAQFNKGGPEAQKAIDTVMKAIMDCDDATLQYQTGVGLFGTMWEDLGADTVASLMNTQGAIKGTSDAMGKMDAAAYDTLESKMSQLGRTIKAEVVQPIAEKLIPVAKDAIDFVTERVGPAVDWILDHLPEIGIALGAVGAAVAAIKWADIVAKVTKVVGAIKGVIAAIGAVAAPVWIIIGVVALLAAAFANLWKNNEEFRNKIIGIWNEIKGKFEEFGQTITNKLNELGFDFESFGEIIRTIWDGLCSFLAPIFEGVFQQVSNILGLALDTLVGLFDVFAGIFTGDWSRAFEGVKQIFSGVWTFCVETFRNFGSVFTGLADTVLGWFGTSWTEVWTKIKNFFVNIWNSIVSFFKGDNVIAQYFRMGWNNIKVVWGVAVSFFKTIFNNIKLVFSAVKSVFSGNFSAAWSSVKQIFANWGSFFSKLWSGVKQIFSNVGGFFRNVFTTAKNGIVSAFSNVYEKLTAPFQKARDAIKGIADKIKGFFSGSISMPKIKMPHFGISPSGWKIGDLLKGSIPKLSISWYKEGGIMTQPTVFGSSGNTLLAGGEAGAEAVLPLSLLWDKMEKILREIFNSQSTTGEPTEPGLTSKAGELLTLDNFSLGSLADGTNVVIYYDFSNFTWSPQIHTDGSGDDEDDLMARLKAHEAEFFDWLEEFIQMREDAQYA